MLCDGNTKNQSSEILSYKPWRSFEIIINDTLEYLCYGSTAVINIFILTVRGSTLDFRI